MPSPSVKLDLEAWNSIFPQERNNDYEYNLLLYKFKSFYNEVKDYQRLHSNCSVTLGASSQLEIDQRQNFSISDGQRAQDTSTNLIASNDKNCSNGDLTLGLPETNGQHVMNLKKKFFQNQDQGLPTLKEPISRQQSVATHLIGQRSQNVSACRQQEQNQSNPVQNHVSIQNLKSIPSTRFQLINRDQPETRQRIQNETSSRLAMSKSSERLDSINNNNNTAVAMSLDEASLDTFQTCTSNVPIIEDGRYMKDEDNIYDAVSPDCSQETQDDTATRPRTIASSAHDLSRSSQQLHRSHLEASKSSSALVSRKLNPIINRNSPIVLPRADHDSSNDRERSNNSFGSSIVLDASNNTSSSLSLVPSLPNQDYANYVNIDFFLKRSQSPSFDGLEEDSSEVSDEEGATEQSHSLSSDPLCDDALRTLSPQEIARKLSSHGHNTPSTSVTPASSADFLDESRTSFANHLPYSSTNIKQPEGNHKFRSFFSLNHRDEDGSGLSSRCSTAPRESCLSKVSPQHQRTLGMIHENKAITSKQTPTRESAQLDSDSSSALVEAHNTMRSFLSDLNLSPVDDVFEDKAQRRIVKESFAVEFCGRRKLRHLFLFNDVIVCAKYHPSSKQKFTFDVKWYLNLNGVTVSDSNDANNQLKFDQETTENQILAIRTNLMLLRSRMQQIKRSRDKKPSKIIKKLKKKRTELEAELVLLLPHLPLVIKHINGKKYTFFLSSNFDRNQWIESIKFLQSQLPASRSSSSTPSSSELQAWIQTCRKNLNPSLGTFLLRPNCDDDLLYGDLYINLSSIKGLPKSGSYYFCFEVDSYGHFSQKASSVVLKIENTEHDLNEEYVFPLDGAHTLRVLLYEDMGLTSKPSVVGKANIELSRSWLFDKPVEKVIEFNSNCCLVAQLSYSNSELLSMRIPHAKLCPSFGLEIAQVCKKEKTEVPLIIQLCVNEVERRGMREIGIYRMSGTSTDIQRLKKAFETNPYVAELLLRDIDINSVTGFLKTYLREVPEGLFINKMYLKFVAAFNIPQSDSMERTRKMLELFHKIPPPNQKTITYLVEHLVKVNKFENCNKMSLTNLATVLGPNILRPPSDSSGANSSDPFTAVVIGSMSQAGILYFFLNRKASSLPLTELDSSELALTSEA